MSYRSILVHVCAPEESHSRYQLAARIALAEQARLTGAAMSGITEFMCRNGAAAAAGALGLDDCSFLTEAAQRDLRAFEAEVRKLGGEPPVSSPVSPPVSFLSDQSASYGLPLAARYCDLLVIGQSHPADALIADDRSLARAVLLHAPSPVLVVPQALPAGGLPSRPLIAWDGSMEASRAVRAALPLLRRAGKVGAVSVAPGKYPLDFAPGACLVDYLACHGIDVVLTELEDQHDAGHAILDFARESKSDLIVMGCYGHSRFREIVLGGATRTVLAEASVPMLMSH